jgi:DNA mismatch repair protein MutL
MGDLIKLLPDAIANQIAAGEVVQRPASAVKELLENSIDADATRVQLILEEAGKQLIQVIDNGKGMSPTDARMCFERHATSKISRTEELFAIRTYGFRGEAMASIAAVAQVEMKTKRAEDETGTHISIEASDFKGQESCAVLTGTNISVRNLFYNIPARRNFLKSDSIELRHIKEELARVALAYPEIEFSLTHNGKDELTLRSETLIKRIPRLLGSGLNDKLMACQEEAGFLKIGGYVGRPEVAKATRGDQYLYVNQRYIKSTYLHHAIASAFEGYIREGTHPTYVLFLELDPAHIDVNVHPTKTEVKFDDERSVYGLVRTAVKKALGQAFAVPQIDYDTNVNQLETLFGFGTSGIKPDRGQNPTAFFRRNQPAGNWEQAYEVLQQREDQSQPQAYYSSRINERAEENEESTNGQPPIQLHQRYILRQVKSGLMLIDQQAAHERILFERFLDKLQRSNGTSQQSLFPLQLDLGAGDYAAVMELKTDLESIGFQVEPMGGHTISVTGAPVEIPESRIKETLESLLEAHKQMTHRPDEQRREALAGAMARKSALRQGSRLTEEEMLSLIDQLFACQNPQISPTGNGTLTILDLEKLAQLLRGK